MTEDLASWQSISQGDYAAYSIFVGLAGCVQGTLSRGAQGHFFAFLRLLDGVAPEGLEQQQAGAAYQAAIGDVEHRPLEPVEIEEIANAVEDQPVVKLSQRAGQNQSQRGAQ